MLAGGAATVGVCLAGVVGAPAAGAVTEPAPAAAPVVSGPISYPGFSSTAGLQLNGSAAASDGVLTLTPDSSNQGGSAYTTSPVDVAGSWTTVFHVMFDGTADGAAFVLQEQGPSALTDPLDPVYGGSGHGYASVDPHVAVDLDRYRGLLSVFTGADWPQYPQGSPSVPLPTSGFCTTAGCQYYVWAEYDAPAQTLAVGLSDSSAPPPAPEITVQNFDPTAILGASTAYAGLAGATGQLSMLDQVLSWSFGPPIVIGHRTDGYNGWNLGPTTETMSTIDDPSAVTCTDGPAALAVSGAGNSWSAVVSGDGVHAVSCNATSVMTGAAYTATDTVQIDSTPPTITFSGNAGSYSVDQTVDITCTASDSTSGVDRALSTCPSATGPAYAFDNGSGTPYILRAVAYDNAGNRAASQTSFTVSVTAASLQDLVDRFSTGRGVARSLDAKIAAIGSAPNARARAGQVGAFDNEVSAQTGKTLTSSEAVVLTDLVQQL